MKLSTMKSLFKVPDYEVEIPTPFDQDWFRDVPMTLSEQRDLLEIGLRLAMEDEVALSLLPISEITGDN